MNKPYSGLRKQGIARRLILSMILFSSLITLIVTAIQLYRDYNRDLLLIESQLDQIEEIHLRSLAYNLWLVDADRLQLLVDGIVRLPDMLYLEVSDDKQILASAGSNRLENAIVRHYPLTYTHLDQDLEIGKIRAVATLERVYSRLIEKTVDILISNAIKTFMVAGFMLLVFHLLVTRRLIDIVNFVRRQDLDEEYTPLRLGHKLANPSKPDELDLVVEELNLMRDKLHKSYIKLKVREKKYRELYDTMAQGVVYQDKKGQILSANNAAQEILGLSIDQMRGVTSNDLRWNTINENGEDFPGETHPAMEALNTGKNINDVVMGVYHPVETEYRWIVVNSKPIFQTGDSKPYQVFSTFTNITQRKHADEERKRLINELETKNMELERFVYTASHELRTPLVTIAGFAEILSDDIARGEFAYIDKHFQQITSAINTMSALLEELLELSRVGHVTSPPVTLELGDLVRDAVKFVSFQAAEKNIKIAIAPDLPLITCDRTRLREVFQNLFENAIKFMGSQPDPVIEVGGEEQGDKLVCYVKDNGIGIDPAYHGRIFNLFEHLDPKTEGTGVGLTLVERIVKMHGGEIWVESDGPQTGSIFYFTLPRTEQRKTE